MECEFMCDDGVSRKLNITAEATAPFGCVYQSRLQTPKGEGVVLGVYAGKLYALLDDNVSALVATAFTKKDFDDGNVMILPDVIPVVDRFASHRVKHDVFCGRSVCIVTQDHNGPCPVIAAANALALLGRVDICPSETRWIESEQLRHIILTYITSNKPEVPKIMCPTTRVVGGTEVATIAVLLQERLDEVRAKLSKGNEGKEFLERLYHGMNISPIFSSIDGFDAEEDVLLFALAGLRLVHGWLIPPDSKYAALREMSFNEVSLLAINKENELSSIANEFLENTKSQLTEEGLKALQENLSEEEVVVLFWNNHFSTAVKLGGRFLLLLSDETYADKSSIFFEAIEDVHGAATFTDGNGVNTDVFLLAVQSRTGNEFTTEAVTAARAKLNERDGVDPSPDEVVCFLRDGKEKGKSEINNSNEKDKWPSWVIEGATVISEMGFDISFTDACELLQKRGSVSAAVNSLC
ncbi:protein fam63a [Trypanosoma theileri]|uniref:Protein fam63a n=1 Tax=Trypanosoma theileri TaxID=67003 RepID=A0A1X0P1H4_9TRYP|nr:protein fam63a [Trypanosoma theileri]ORC90755.1 protein fam63a [Trypanosoma theileri]